MRELRSRPGRPLSRLTLPPLSRSVSERPPSSPQEVLESRLPRLAAGERVGAESNPLCRRGHAVDEARPAGHYPERWSPFALLQAGCSSFSAPTDLCWALSPIITSRAQVDGLHQKAFPYSQSETANRILDLHGTLHLVHCRNGHVVSRAAYQERLSELNPSWKAFADEAERTGTLPATNPDGDVRCARRCDLRPNSETHIDRFARFAGRSPRQIIRRLRRPALSGLRRGRAFSPSPFCLGLDASAS